MVQRPESGTLAPVKFDQILKEVPELNKFNFNIQTVIFNPALDSSNMNPSVWVKIALTIKKNYNDFDGFVILHGTDTMAYTASA
jgi:L-asparaginase